MMSSSSRISFRLDRIRCQLCPQRLQSRSNPVVLLRGAIVDGYDRGTLVQVEGHEPLGLEAAQCLAHQGWAHVEALSQLSLRKGLAGLQLTAEHELT